jgi:hypothetical protein
MPSRPASTRSPLSPEDQPAGHFHPVRLPALQPTGDSNPAEPFGIASIPLKSNGSFTATTTETGVYAGYKAKFTYTFRGNYQGADSSGAARAAGTFRETMTFNDGTARTCTSNTQSWTAAHS